MMNRYKKLISDTAVLGLGTFGSKLLVFLLMPLYTALLSTSEYGAAELITSVANLLIPLACVGITNGIFRFAAERGSDKAEVFSSSVALLGIGVGAFLLLSRELRPLRERVSRRVPRLVSSRPWQSLLCVGTFLTAGLFRTLDLNPRTGQTIALWWQMLAPSTTGSLLDRTFWTALGLNGAQWALLGCGVILMWWVSRNTPRLQDGENSTLRARFAARPWLCAALCALAVCAVLIFGHYGMGYDASSFIYGQF